MTKDKITDINIKNIPDFLNTDYRDYVFYVLQNRALPDIRDGLKTGARKILHAAFNGGLKNGQSKKLLNLSGDTMNLSLYQHGDSSLNGTIITLSQDFNFNLNPLYIDGQNGSLRNPKGVSAPRYLYVRLSEFSDLWKTDYDLLNFVFDEGQYVEPETYLPVIPTVVANRQSGMAPGYRFSTMSYDPVDLIDACITCLKSRKRGDKLADFVIHPYIRGIDKKNWKSEEGQWVNRGTFKYEEKKKLIKVTDLPYDTDFDTFEKLLNKLVEKEEIRDWHNYSEGNDVEYHVDCKRGSFVKTLKGKSINQKIESKFKLKKIVPDDLLWVLDEKGKIKHFINVNELVEYFVNWRLTKYDERKSKLVKVLEERYKKNSELVRFIELVCKGKLKIRNRNKSDIKTDMNTYKLPFELITTPMSRCTVEERDELLRQNEQIKQELEYIKKTTTKQMYVNDLEELRKKYVKIFK